MSQHMPPVPPANRSHKGPGSDPKMSSDTTTDKHGGPENLSEQGDTANIKQNTTNKGYFAGRKTK